MESVVAVEASAEETERVLVGLRGVGGVHDVHDVVVLRLAVLAAPGEALRRLRDLGIRPDAQTVHERLGAAEGEEHVDGRCLADVLGGEGLLVEVEDSLFVGHVGGDGEALRDNEAVGVGRGGRQQRHERVELESGRGLQEVQLDRHDGVGGCHFETGTDETVIGVRGVAAARGRFLRDGAVGEVVAEHLHAVDVHHDTVLVLNARLVSSHARHAQEALAEVLGLRYAHGRGQHAPRRVVEGVLRPVAVEDSGHLPLRILLDRVVQRQSVGFGLLLGHHVLEEDVAVNTLDFEP